MLRKENILKQTNIVFCAEVISNSSRLKDDAVPTIFDFPSSSHTVVGVKRKPPRKRCLEEPSLNSAEQSSSGKVVKKSPTEEELLSNMEKQRRKIRSLQHKVRRYDSKVNTLQGILDDLKSRNLLRDSHLETLENSFSGLSADIIINHFKNQERSQRGNRHNVET